MMVRLSRALVRLMKQRPPARRLKRRNTCTLSLFLQDFFPSICIQANQAVIVEFPLSVDRNEAVIGDTV